MRRLLIALVVLAGCAGSGVSSSEVSDSGASSPDVSGPDSVDPGIAGSDAQDLPTDEDPGVARTAPEPVGETAPASEPEGCDGALTFEHSPVDLDSIEYINPLGLMIDSHVTPVDHQYFQNFVDQELWIDVYSPAAGRVTHIQHMNRPVAEDTSGVVDDYRIVIEHSCTISSIFIHVGELEPPLAAVAPAPGDQTSVDVRLEAGELIGRFQANVDYNVVDLDFTTDGLLMADTYRVEPWKIHTPDPFGYFDDEIRARMEQLSLRNAEPKGGVFTYDIDGRLVGNWFEEDTNGYGGNNRERYWSTHLAVAYDHLDPTLVMVSIGDFGGRSRQLGVAGNSPDPADVSVETGPVLYELVEIDYWVGDQRWDRISLASGIQARESAQTQGAVLFELVESSKLRVEVFPGVAAADVAGFTDAALTYTR